MEEYLNHWSIPLDGHVTLMGGSLVGQSLKLAEMAHKKTSIHFAPGTFAAQIYLDDELFAQESGSHASSEPFVLSMGVGYQTNLVATYTLERTGHYAVCKSFGAGTSGGMSELVAKKIMRLKRQGFSDDSPELLSESLRYTGQCWMEEEAQLPRMFPWMPGGHGVEEFYQLGIMAAEQGGFYIDAKNGFTADPDQLAGFSPGYLGSALEHAVLEQIQPGNASGASTIRVLVEALRSGQKIYQADSGNWSTVKSEVNWSIEPQMEDDILNRNGIYVFPQTEINTIEQWSGRAFAGRTGDTNNFSYFMSIDGYNGGFNALKTKFKAAIQWFSSLPEITSRRDANSVPTSRDPVDMRTGEFLFNHTDLSFAGALPLTFSRSYRSGAPQEGTLGTGWTHSFNIRAQEHSAIRAAMGRSTEEMASPLLGMAITKDLLSNAASAKEWAVAALIANWTATQLTQNAVSIYLGSKALTFIRQPGGSYTPPPGMTVSLVKTNGLYAMQQRHANRYEFDANLNVSRIVDTSGNTLVFAYNTQTNLDTVTSSFGPAFTFHYNASNRVESVSDNSGRSVSYQYDAKGNPTNFVDAAGGNWGIAYGDTNFPYAITSLIDPEGIVTIQNAYNAFGQVTNQTSATGQGYDEFVTDYQSTERSPLGHQTTYRYDTLGRIVEQIHPDGSTTHTGYDTYGRVVLSSNEIGVTNALAYDVNHNLLSQTNAVGMPEQVVTTYGYDSTNHLRFVTNAVGAAEQTVTEYTYTPEHKPDVVTVAKGTAEQTVTDYDYTAEGLVQQVSEGNGKRVTTYSNFDSHGNAQTVNSSDAGTVGRTFDIRGNLTSQTIDGKTSSFGYNKLGQLVAATNALGTADQAIVSKTYWKNGLLKTATDARGKPTRHYWTDAYKPAGTVLPNTGSTTNIYDAADRLVRARDAEGNWTTNTLDSVGRPVSVSSAHSVVTNQFNAVGNITNSVVDPSGLSLWTATEYDALNQPKSVQSALSAVNYHYDPLGRVTNRVDAASKDWKTEFDELGRVKKTFRPSGHYEEYGFDALGNRTHFWNAEGKPSTFGVDARGRVTSITNAIGKVTEFTFDDSGNLATRLNAENELTEYGYNSLNRLIAITNQGIEVATFDHDANGNLVGQTSLSAQATFGYDEMNQLVASTQTVNGVTAKVGYQYDLNGNRTHVTYPGNTNAVYVYGADNRLESVDLSAFGISSAIEFNYDSASRLTNIVYPNGVTSTFGLDAEGRVVSIQHGSFIDRTIIRNALGFKETELIDAGIKPTVPDTERRIKTHNDADQLVSEQVQAGTNWATVAYSYSANGCLTNAVAPNSDSVSHTYDYDNRLVGTTEGTEHTEYLYDASGARIGRIAGILPATVTTNYFVIDYADGLKRPLAETDASGTVTRYYVWAGTRLLAHIEANGDVFYYHSDELGSTLALTDKNGALTDEFAYMPYGYATHTPHTGSTDTPFQWLGGYGVYYDSTTDLHLTLHRAYSCSLKRFIQPDPLGIDGGVNVYAMANLNPLAFIDPYGLEAGSAGGDNWLISAAKAYWEGVQLTYDALNRGSEQILNSAGQTVEFLFDMGERAANDPNMGPLIFAAGPLAAAPEGIAAISGAGANALAWTQNAIYQWGAATSISSPILYETSKNLNPIRPTNFEVLSTPAVQNAVHSASGFMSGYVPGPPSPVSGLSGLVGYGIGATESPYK